MIYFDNAATTRVRKELLPLIEKYNNLLYFNPSALYKGGLEVAQEIQASRKKLVKILEVEGNITFASSGTECNNHVLFCAKKRKNSRIITTALEHASILSPLNELKQMGYDVVYCPVNKDGSVNEQAFCELLNTDTSLVSIMHVNNETGAINDIANLVKITKRYNPSIHFHSDGVQAFCKVAVNLNQLNVDSYTISGHKIGAPKGVAALYLKKGLHLKPLLYGGGQEYGLRSSTENVSSILAFAEAASIGISQMYTFNRLANEIFGHVKCELAKLDEVLYITPDLLRAPHILTFALPDIKGEVMLHALESRGIYIGTGSACSSNKKTRNINTALGLTNKYKDNIIRLSISINNTLEEAKIVVNAIIEEYHKLSPFVRG